MSRLPQRCRKLFTLLAISFTLHTSVSRAQIATPPSQTVEQALHQMSDLAGVIFVGEVTAVREKPGQQGASGIVEIDFRIDQPVRDCLAGSTYTLREWAGLWQAGDQRYRVGQRLLMMLHTPGPAGISSPVDGMNGAIPVVPAIFSSQMLATADTATPPLTADLKWIVAQLARPAPFPATGAQLTAQSLPGTLSATNLQESQQTPLPTVIQMLSSWQKTIP